MNDHISNIDLYGHSVEEKRIISLYQDGLFDNIELRVLLDNNAVAQKTLVSD